MNTDRIKVLIAHRKSPVYASLQAAFSRQPDFETTTRDMGGACEPALDPELRGVNVAVADCETGIRLVAPAFRCGCHVLIVTEDESEASIRRAVDLGVRGYLLLTSSPESIVRATRDVSHGAIVLDPNVMTKVVNSLARPPLTPREMDVLGLLVAGNTNKTVAERLACRIGTVKMHVKAILEKLDSPSRPEAAVAAHRLGLIPLSSHHEST